MMFGLNFDEPLQRARASDEAFTQDMASDENTARLSLLSFWMCFIQSRRCSCHGLEADVTIVITKRDKMTIR